MDVCPTWSRVADIYEQEHEHSLKDVQTRLGRDARSCLFHLVMLLASLLPIKMMRRCLLRRAYRRKALAENGRELYHIIDAFRETTGAAIIIDSSKSVEQLHALIAAKPSDVDLKLIHIIRDGRAVLYSKAKRTEQLKQYGWTFKLIPAIRGWCYVNLQILNTMCFFDSKETMFIHYEDLCNDWEATLRRICRQFEIDFDERMLHLSRENKHNVGGSPHRFTYNADTPIRLDQRWKSGLSPWHRIVYYIVAGIVHKRLGY